MVDSSEEEVFEVEEIQAHKFTKKNKEVLYFIKWLNYPTDDNTWEKEGNVFAVDLIEKYWSAMPSTSKDRRQFERINNSRKNPIKLTASPVVEQQIPTVISADSMSPPVSTSNSTTTKSEASSVIATAIKNAKQQSTLDSIFGVHKGKGKEKEVAQPPRLPQVIATAANEDDDMEDDLPVETMEIDSSDDEAYVTPTRTLEQSISLSDGEMDTETTPSNKSAAKTLANINKQQQEDYFLKQHEKKRKREELGFDDDSSIESMSPPPKNKKAVVDIEEVQDDEEVIFDEKYAIDPPLDWETQTERVEYIGKEIDQSDLYCLVRWKDGVKSMHPLNLVREKRPDLVIDRFVKMVKQQ